MVDDYAGYMPLFARDGQVDACIELGGLAHARRKFYDLHQANQSPMAWEAFFGGASAKALDYSSKRWPVLTRYAETGHLPIGNNPIDGLLPLDPAFLETVKHNKP